MSRSIRLLHLLQHLREQRYPVTAQRLAEYLQISVRSVYRDIESLRDQGVNIEGSRGLGFQLKENFLLPPMSLDESEIEAMYLALQWAKSIPDHALQQASHSVLSKLKAVLPQRKQEFLNDTYLKSIHSFIHGLRLTKLLLNKFVSQFVYKLKFRLIMLMSRNRFHTGNYGLLHWDILTTKCCWLHGVNFVQILEISV